MSSIKPNNNIQFAAESAFAASPALQASKSVAATSSTSRISSPLLYDLTLVSPWFELTLSGRKSFEGRLNRKQIPLVKAEDYFRITHADKRDQKSFLLQVKHIHHFSSFDEALHSSIIPLASALPDVGSIEAGVDIYKQFYTEEEQKKFGVVFIQVQRVLDDASLSIERSLTPALRRLSLWLEPTRSSRMHRHFEQVIGQLSKQHDQPVFAPHITLASFVWPATSEWTVQQLAERLSEAMEIFATPTFTIDQVALHPQAIFMVIFCLIRRSPMLLQLRQRVFDVLIQPLSALPSSQPSAGACVDPAAWPTAWPFVPHLSLLYDKQSQINGATRVQSLADMRVDNVSGWECLRNAEFEVDRVSIVAIDSNDYDTRWHELASVSFPSKTLTTLSTALPAASKFPSPSQQPNEFRSQIVDKLNHGLFLQLVLDRNPPSAAKETALLVWDGQVVAEWVVGSTLPRAPTASLFTDENKQRMICYFPSQPSNELQSQLREQGIYCIVFAPDSTKLTSVSTLLL